MQTSGFHKHIQYKSISESYLWLWACLDHETMWLSNWMTHIDEPQQASICFPRTHHASNVPQCLTPFLLTKACSGHRAMHMVGFLKAYQSLLSENAWIMPNANRTAEISYSESWKSFPRFQNCHLSMVVHHGTKRISALEPCASRTPGHMGWLHPRNGEWLDGLERRNTESLRKSPENDRKSLSNPLSAWIPARSHNFASCVWTTVLSDPPLGETWARTCKMSSIRVVWEDLL